MSQATLLPLIVQNSTLAAAPNDPALRLLLGGATDDNVSVLQLAANETSTTAFYSTDGTYQAWLSDGSEAGVFYDGVRYVVLANGDTALEAYGNVQLDAGWLSIASTYDIRFNGPTDGNWRMGVFGDYSTLLVGDSTSLKIIVGAGSSGPDGLAICNSNGTSLLEIRGDDGTTLINGPLNVQGQVYSTDGTHQVYLSNGVEAGAFFDGSNEVFLATGDWAILAAGALSLDYGAIQTNGDGIFLSGGGQAAVSIVNRLLVASDGATNALDWHTPGQAVFGSQYSATRVSPAITSYATTVDWNASNVQRVQLDHTGSITITLSNPVGAGRYVLMLKQDSTGGCLCSFSGTIRWQGGSAPTLTTTANHVDLISFIYDDVDDVFYGAPVLDFH